MELDLANTAGREPDRMVGLDTHLNLKYCERILCCVLTVLCSVSLILFSVLCVLCPVFCVLRSVSCVVRSVLHVVSCVWLLYVVCCMLYVVFCDPCRNGPTYAGLDVPASIMLASL